MTTKRASAPARALIAGCLAGMIGSADAASAAELRYDAPRVVASYPAVAVPAPIPVPEAFRWYVRADIGYAMHSDAAISQSGPAFDVVGPNEHNGAFHGGLGIGRYITPSLRAEVSVETRNERPVVNGASRYSFTRDELLAGPPVSTDTHTFSSLRDESANIDTHTGMFNLYYDLKPRLGLTPYVGVGAGVVASHFKRRFRDSASCVSSTNDVTGPYLDPIFLTPICVASASQASAGGKKSMVQWGPALALMTGVAFELHTGVLIDVGYRLLWQGNTPNLTVGSASGEPSTIRISERTDHELRAGIRLNIW